MTKLERVTSIVGALVTVLTSATTVAQVPADRQAAPDEAIEAYVRLRRAELQPSTRRPPPADVVANVAASDGWQSIRYPDAAATGANDEPVFLCSMPFLTSQDLPTTQPTNASGASASAPAAGGGASDEQRLVVEREFKAEAETPVLTALRGRMVNAALIKPNENPAAAPSHTRTEVPPKRITVDAHTLPCSGSRLLAAGDFPQWGTGVDMTVYTHETIPGRVAQVELKSSLHGTAADSAGPVVEWPADKSPSSTGAGVRQPLEPATRHSHYGGT